MERRILDNSQWKISEGKFIFTDYNPYSLMFTLLINADSCIIIANLIIPKLLFMWLLKIIPENESFHGLFFENAHW